jgi:hypothetical protein
VVARGFPGNWQRNPGNEVIGRWSGVPFHDLDQTPLIAAQKRSRHLRRLLVCHHRQIDAAT